MIGKFIQSIFGSKNERDLRRMAPVVDLINRLEPRFQAYSDTELLARTAEFKERLSRGETLDEILCCGQRGVCQSSGHASL
jgi:preprotein translocase subunit SecA